MEFVVCDPDKLDKFYLHQGHEINMVLSAKSIAFICSTCKTELIKISLITDQYMANRLKATRYAQRLFQKRLEHLNSKIKDEELFTKEESNNVKAK